MKFKVNDIVITKEKMAGVVTAVFESDGEYELNGNGWRFKDSELRLAYPSEDEDHLLRYTQKLATVANAVVTAYDTGRRPEKHEYEEALGILAHTTHMRRALIYGNW